MPLVLPETYDESPTYAPTDAQTDAPDDAANPSADSTTADETDNANDDETEESTVEEEAATKSGRATTEMVAKRAPSRLFPHVVGERLVKLTIKEDGKQDVEIIRPSNGDRTDPVFALWTYADSQRRMAADRAGSITLMQDSKRVASEERASISRMLQEVRRVVAQPQGTSGSSVKTAARDAPRASGSAVSTCDVPRRGDLAQHLRPVRVGVLGKGDVEPATRWQTKDMDEGLMAEIESRWYIEITENTKDCGGRDFVPGGTKGASLCGGFPHAIIKPKLGPHREKSLYVVGGSHDVFLNVSLRRRPDGNVHFPDPVSESEVLMLLRERLPAEEVAAWYALRSNPPLQALFQLTCARVYAGGASRAAPSSTPRYSSISPSPTPPRLQLSRTLCRAYAPLSRHPKTGNCSCRPRTRHTLAATTSSRCPAARLIFSSRLTSA